MKTLRRVSVGTALFVAIAGFASADSINYGTGTGVENATGGTISALSSPASTNPSTGSTSVSAFNLTAVNAEIQANCPTGFTCGAANLYEIDLGIVANTSGSMDITNSGGAGLIDCFAGTCNKNTPTTGIAAEGTASLQVIDPNSENQGFGNKPTFTVATSVADTTNNTSALPIGSGTTHESGTNVVNIPVADIYDSTNDPNWLSDKVAYTVSPVNFSLILSGSQQIGNAPTGVGTANTVAALSSGQITVNYLFNFSEVSNNTVPEPATLALMGGALIGLGMLGKRLKKS